MTTPQDALTANEQSQAVELWRCPECGCRSHDRVDEMKPNGKFGPGPLVRCVHCKRTDEWPRAVEREAAVPGGEDRPPLTPQQLAAFIESMAENPRGGKPARSAYLHAARLIRERLA